MRFESGNPSDARRAQQMDCAVSIHQTATPLKGKAARAWERKREEGGQFGRPWEGEADKRDRCCVDEIGESLLCTQWVGAPMLMK